MASPESLRALISDFATRRKEEAAQLGISFPSSVLRHDDNILLSAQTATVMPGSTERSSSATLLQSLQQSFQKDLLAVVDATVHAHVEQLLCADDRNQIHSWLREMIDGSFELFWGTLESISRLPEKIDPNNPEDYLRKNEDLALAAIETIRRHPRCSEILERIRFQCGNASLRSAPVGFFRGAAVPSSLPLFERFGELCAQDGIKFDVFDGLMKNLKDAVQEGTQELQSGYPISGVREGWRLLYTLFLGRDPNARIFTTSHGYLPMILDPKHFHIVGGETVEEITNALLKDIDQEFEGAETFHGDGMVHAPILLLSSVRRDGTRVDVEAIAEPILSKYPDAMLVIDAAQDHVLFPNADFVLYGKRFGGTGTGIMMISNNFHDGIHQACEVRSGYDVRDLARSFAAVRCELKSRHFANHFSDLLHTPTLWNFTGGGTYVSRLCATIEDACTERQGLSKNFELSFDHVDENPSGFQRPSWKSSRLIALKKRPHSSLDLSDVARQLKEFGIQVDWYSLSLLQGYKALAAQADQQYDPDEARNFCYRLAAFQHIHYAYIVNRMLVLPEVFNQLSHPRGLNEQLEIDEDTFYRQVEFFHQGVREQEMLRILVDLRMQQDDVVRLINVLDAVVSEQTITP